MSTAGAGIGSVESLPAVLTGPPDRLDARRAFVVLASVTVVLWLGLLWLGTAFLRTSLDWEYVAEQSRVGAPWYYRLAGVWGGMEGSLLLFTGIAAAAAVVAARRATVSGRWAALATVLALVLIDIVLASPFERLDVPATIGFGMNPILEHPAMAIHPPMLYAGLAAAGGAAIVAVGAPDPWTVARRWLLASVALLTAAMTLGAAWSYMEQGWGGYWAWDPVENTSLLVWMAALVAIHAAPRSLPPLALATIMAPWTLAVLGGALVRSGRTPSVHGFAEQLGVGWAMFALAIATALGATWLVVQRRNEGGPQAGRDPRRVMVLLMTIAGAIVVVGSVAPVLHDVIGSRSTAVGGQFFARTVGPLALVAVPFLALQLRRRRGLHRDGYGWSSVAHAGVLVLVAGVGVSTFDDIATFGLGNGDERRAAGVDVRNDGVTVGDGPRQGTEAVTAAIAVDGDLLHPRIVVYPDRGGRLAEVAVHTGPVTDVHVTLETANDNQSIVVTVHRRHGMWLIWLGAVLVTVATFGAARRRGPPGVAPRAAPAGLVA